MVFFECIHLGPEQFLVILFGTAFLQFSKAVFLVQIFLNQNIWQKAVPNEAYIVEIILDDNYIGSLVIRTIKRDWTHL
ncbi:hypothetical protein M5K25_027535 [Dendrobium thyrsiflorum]|uniref:Uncharacterized protein n=1 Tax=Dendrobium thyrsiflorum TaxID=117978 RepID=A0ABD0TU91_DENTH